LEWVHQVGLAALAEVFEHDAEQLAGPKGRHHAGRSHYRWGSMWSELPFGGRLIRLRRPRLRGAAGGEAKLPSLEEFRAGDPVPVKVLNQILLSVSTRGCRKNLDAAPAGITALGASKGAASRHQFARMTEKLRSFLTRRLDQLDLLVLMLEGLQIARHTVVVNMNISLNFLVLGVFARHARGAPAVDLCDVETPEPSDPERRDLVAVEQPMDRRTGHA